MRSALSYDRAGQFASVYPVHLQEPLPDSSQDNLHEGRSGLDDPAQRGDFNTRQTVQVWRPDGNSLLIVPWRATSGS